MRLQSIIRAIYPAQCIACEVQTETEFGLCGACWGQTRFIAGTICDSCGVPLPGDDPGEVVQCDDCMTIARPWARGRSALLYTGVGRTLVLRLKHADRTELVRPAAGWMAQVAAHLVQQNTLLVPVPLHWGRLIKRRYNQAALLAHAMGRVLGCAVEAQALTRTKRTKPLEGHSRDARFAALDGAIRAHPRYGARMQGRPVLLVDDVMTSGATLAACAEAASTAGAENVSIVTLARVAKDN